MPPRRGGGQGGPDPPRDQQPSTPSPSFQRGGGGGGGRGRGRGGRGALVDPGHSQPSAPVEVSTPPSQRGPDPPRDQQPSTPSPSFQRGGGGGGGGRGRGRGGRGALVDPGHSQPSAPVEVSTPPSQRGPDPPRDQQPSTPSPSFQRGGGGGGGGRGRGRGGRGALIDPGHSQPSAPVEVSTPPSLASPSSPSFPPLARPTYAAPTLKPTLAQPPAVSSVVQATTPHASSSSGPVEQLSKEVDVKLTLAPPRSSKSLRPPARPGFGTEGRKIMVRANHFLVEIADKDLHHYDVTITPEVTSKKVNRDVISELVRLYRMSDLGEKRPAYDGRKSLYTAGSLPFESKQFVVKLTEDSNNDGRTRPGSSTSTGKEREFKVAIKYAARIDAHHLRQFLNGRQLDVPQETVQILDTALRMTPSEKYVVVGRSFFSPQVGPTHNLGDGVECWRGYYQSLRPIQMGLSLNTDVSATAFFEALFINEFVAKYLNVRDLSRALPDQDRVKVKRALKGVKVRLTYLEYPKTYKITSVSPKPVNQTMFTLEDGRTVSVAQFFFERYNVRLKYPLLPALQAGNNARPVFLPMELCRIVEGQRYSRKLNERQVAGILKASCQRPSEREASIKKMVAANGYNTTDVVREFGISVKDQLTLINARVLPPPLLKYHNQGRESVVNPQQGAWNMINKKMVNGGRVDCWALVNFSQRVHPDFPFEFCRQLIEMCTSKGMLFNPNPIVPICSAHHNQIEKTLVDIHNQADAKLANQNGKYLQLLIIILPDFSGSYGKIKRICETELGIVTQCCRPSEASKLSKQYLENLSLKINVKVGGRNMVLNDAMLRRIHLVSDVPTIIFGADVTHPSPGEDFSPSIAAVVASMDWPEVTKYRGIVSAQSHREEIIQDLYKTHHDPKRGLVTGGMIRELLIAFRRATGQKPCRIIFYRDGVSEGQFSQVLLHEMDAIWKACGSLEEGYLPPVTFIVVQKRHHTRLFPADHSDRSLSDRSGNILPGTVVDTGICHPTEHDFYLNSHAGIKGTSRPTHYHVLFDENNFSADKLQALTNNLCYTYARCTRAVSIVPPAYYAHLAAFRARYYLEDCKSDGASSAEGVRGGNTEFMPLPTIKGNVKEVMFYC